MAFQIERMRKYLVGHKPAPGRPHRLFEHSDNGFLVTGYEDGSDWLVSPLGRHTWGRILRDRPTAGWAIGADRRDYHRMHLYILDLPAKSHAEVSGLSLTRNYNIVDYDGERLVLICPTAAGPGVLTRELVIVDIASAKIADRFVLKGYTNLFRFYRSDSVGLTPDGWLILDVSLLGENNERLYKHGIARIHPLTREMSFETFPVEGHAHVLISPSGRHVLKANKTVRPVSGLSTGLPATPAIAEGQECYERLIEMWADEKRFFGLVEKLGSAAAPALTRLVAKCRLDADLPRVWSGNPEDGRQAFGAAAKALGGVDPGAWVELAEYEKCIDDFHELYFRNEVVPHFIKSHGWREENFALALADIVQVRGNLGDDFSYSWRRSGLAAAAEAAYAPEAFADLMLSIRDRMLASPVGTFANFVARVAEDPPSSYGWHNYDRLFGQIKGSLTAWEVHVFAALQDRAGR